MLCYCNDSHSFGCSVVKLVTLFLLKQNIVVTLHISVTTLVITYYSRTYINLKLYVHIGIFGHSEMALRRRVRVLWRPGGPAQIQNGPHFHALLWLHDALVVCFLHFYLIIRPSSKLACALQSREIHTFVFVGY